MSRKIRIWYEGACYHLMGRGNRHCEIFKEPEDYKAFLLLMESIKKKYPFILHACCLMTNHFHLEVTTVSDPVWKIMHLLMNNYARNFNKKYGYDGHLFDSRYCSALIENDGYFMEVSRYIHLNPVKAKIVTDPLNYEYSSYGLFVNPDINNPNINTVTNAIIRNLVDPTRVLSWFGDDPRKRYRMFVEGDTSHEDEELRIRKDMNENELWVPGNIKKS